MPTPAIKNTNFHSVLLHTWGTDYQRHGLSKQLHRILWGGNCGHAALEITFPADQLGQAYIQQYCLKNGKTIIPFERITQTGYKNNQLVQQDVYKIYFSYWDERYGLVNNINLDNQLERPGRDTGPFNTRFGIQTESETTMGKLGTQAISLSPIQIIHDGKNLINADQKNLLELERKLALEKRALEMNPTYKKLCKLHKKIRQDSSHPQVIEKNTIENQINLLEANLNQIQSALVQAIAEMDTKINTPSPEQKKITKLEEKIKNLYQSIENLEKNINNTNNPLKKDVLEQLYQLQLKKNKFALAEILTRKQNNDFLQANHQRYVTMGLTPDHSMPIQDLNIENMLKTMREIQESGTEFDLYTHNCSDTTSRILSAGAKPERQHYFDKKALGVFLTPQKVFNNALKYQKAILAVPATENNTTTHTNHYGILTLVHRINQQVKKLIGMLLLKLSDKTNSYLKHSLLIAALAPLGALIGLLKIIKNALKLGPATSTNHPVINNIMQPHISSPEATLPPAQKMHVPAYLATRAIDKNQDKNKITDTQMINTVQTIIKPTC